MNPSRPLQLGSVVWAELEDANGYRKVRPVVLVTPTADLDLGRPLRVVAITTRLPDPFPRTMRYCLGIGRVRLARA